jgi:monofunctional glycosyltransferase
MNKPLVILLRIFSIIWFIIKTALLTYAIAFSIAGTIGLVMAYQFVTTPIRQVKAFKNANPKETVYMTRYRATLGPADSLVQTFMPLDSISGFLRNAVLAAEDDGFFTHPGIDIEAMLAAMEYNRQANEIKLGASTITQQLAKNCFLTGEKNFERKGKELLYTILLEKYLGKKRILELYLNYAQWGKTVFGCEAASQRYFKKSCKHLSRMEAARLAAVLAMPNKVSPLNTNSQFIGKRIAVIASNLYLHRLIDDSGYTDLTGNPPPNKDTTDLAGATPVITTPPGPLAPAMAPPRPFPAPVVETKKNRSGFFK